MVNPKPRTIDEYREQQALLAIWRDSGYCTICWFYHKRQRAFQQVHHVYGRSRKMDSFREQYNSLLCVCLECHPLPIQFPGGNLALAYVEDVLAEANQTPINDDFRRSE